MLIACWSTKGGVGTSVVAAALALLLGRTADRGAVLADLAGDAPAVLGLPEPVSPGLAGWLSAGDRVPADALARIEIEVAPGVALLPRGDGPLSPGRVDVLAALLDEATRPTVADCGRVDDPTVTAVATRASRSLLVTRSCFVALRRVQQAAVRASGSCSSPSLAGCCRRATSRPPPRPRSSPRSPSTHRWRVSSTLGC